MALSRRNALAFLGLASSGSAALAAERLINDEHASSDQGMGHLPQLGMKVSRERIADAFQRLADGLRSGHVVPDADEGAVLKIESLVGTDDWFHQRLTFGFYITEPDQPYK